MKIMKPQIILKAIKNFPEIVLEDFRETKHYVFRCSVEGNVFIITVSKTKHHGFNLRKMVEGDFKRALRNFGFDKLSKDFKLEEK